jgi:hypothetical protein
LSFDPSFKPFDGIWLAAFSPCMSVLMHATLVLFGQKHHPQNLGLVSFQQSGLYLFCVFKFKSVFSEVCAVTSNICNTKRHQQKGQ